MSKKVEETKVEEVVFDPYELVDYIAPLLPGTKQKDIFVAVNGETCVIKRGVPVKVKRMFKEALDNAQNQQYAAYQAMVQIQQNGAKATANM
jgi:hypothetical protein